MIRLQCYDALQSDLDELTTQFQTGRFDDLSRIELVHFDMPGAVGMVGYVATRPYVPVFHVRPALYHRRCHGNRLADKVLSLAKVPP